METIGILGDRELNSKVDGFAVKLAGIILSRGTCLFIDDLDDRTYLPLRIQTESLDHNLLEKLSKETIGRSISKLNMGGEILD